MKTSSTGLNEDTRTVDQKEFDFKTSEIFGTTPVTYLNQSNALKYVDFFTLENQQQESSCVAHGKSLVIAINKNLKDGSPYVQPAPVFVYRLRINYPNSGMFLADADNITRKFGVPKFADLPTPPTEAEVNALSIPDKVYAEAMLNRAGNWVSVDDPTNIDEIAFVVNTLGIAMSILIFATDSEWWQNVPNIQNPVLTMGQASVRHCITVLPKSAYRNDIDGKRYVIIQDSAGYYGTSQFRNVSEDFIKARCYGADYDVELQSTVNNKITAYTFNTDLSVGSKGADVTALQSVLQSMGFFPSIVNDQLLAPTGFYGGITKNAVCNFQLAYADKILKPLGLIQPTGIFGQSTRMFLNGIIDR